jgi:hypothetical protein
MATTKLILNGTLYWAKVFEFNRVMKDHLGDLIKSKPTNMVSDEDAGRYEIEIRLSKEEATKIARAGARQKPKMDKETGFPKEFDEGYAYRFTRFHVVPKAAPAGGQPQIEFRDGTKFDPELHGLIGNGTTGSLEVRVDKFEIKNREGKTEQAARAVLQKVIIDSLVEYWPDKVDEVIGGDEDETPVQPSAPKASKPAVLPDEDAAPAMAPAQPQIGLDDDSIPF